jgi:hypothetical protein
VLIVTMLTISTHVHRASAAAASGDEQVHKLLMLAFDNITRGLCENNKRCAPATEQERANPPITIAEARIVISRGALSGAAELCGLDWAKRNFEPMMTYWRRTQKKNERQMALIGIVHGITQGFGNAGLKSGCTNELRERVDSQLNFKP